MKRAAKIVTGLVVAAIAVLTGCCSCDCGCCTTRKEPNISVFASFVRDTARKRGITITVEDFGGCQNPGSYAKYLKRFLDEIPDIKFALDSGNLYYANRGEDILDMMEYAKGRIGHIHLKDQYPENHQKYQTLGLGGVPNERIVKTMNAAGYDGWYTLENAVPGADTYTEAVRQVAVLKSWLAEADGRLRRHTYPSPVGITMSPL